MRDSRATHRDDIFALRVVCCVCAPIAPAALRRPERLVLRKPKLRLEVRIVRRMRARDVAAARVSIYRVRGATRIYM